MNDGSVRRVDDEPSSPAPSVSQWIDDLRERGDGSAARRLWRRYAPRMARIAQKRIQGARCGAADEEDIVAEAFAQFIERAGQGGFAQLADRRDLWQILMSLTDRRAIDHLRRESRRGKRVRFVGESHLFPAATGSRCSPSRRNDGIASVPDARTAEHLAADFHEWLQQLDDPALRRIVLGRLQGFTNQELAGQLQTSLRSVERKLARLRSLWESRVDP